MMYWSNSAEYAQMIALLLGEQEVITQIQKIKESTSDEVDVSLLRIECDVYRWMNHPTKKIWLTYNSGKEVEHRIDELYKVLKEVRLDLSTLVMSMVAKHQDDFTNMNIKGVPQATGHPATDFKKAKRFRR